MRVKIERILLSKDCIPSQIAPHRFLQVLKPSLVYREEDKGVAEKPWGIATCLQNCFCGDFGEVTWLLAIGMVDPQRRDGSDHRAHPALIGWYTGKVTGLAEINAKPFIQLLHHRIDVALELLRAVLRQLRNCGLS